MSISKIDKKYCLGYRAQLMLIKGSNQAIFSKNGILYLRVPISEDEVVSIHKYLADKDRPHFPYHDRPVSERQHNHIFDCDTIYADITCAGESSSLNFKLFKKQNTGDVLLEELGVRSFESEETEFTADAETVKKYLERQPDENARFIFDTWRAVNSGNAISYVSANDCEQVINRLDIPLDDKSILAKYNKKIEPIEPIIFYFSLFGDNEEMVKERQEQLRKEREERVWERKSVDEVEEFSLTEVEEFCLTEEDIFETSNPYIIALKDDGTITATVFDVRFMKTNEFLVKQRKYTISKDAFRIEKGIDPSTIHYTGDPTYIKTEYPPESTPQAPVSPTSDEPTTLPSNQYKLLGLRKRF